MAEAFDLPIVQAAAQPSKAAASKPAPADNETASFAEVLNAETSPADEKTETADTDTAAPAPDATVAANGSPAAQPDAAPVVTTPAAILLALMDGAATPEAVQPTTSEIAPVPALVAGPKLSLPELAIVAPDASRSLAADAAAAAAAADTDVMPNGAKPAEPGVATAVAAQPAEDVLASTGGAPTPAPDATPEAKPATTPAVAATGAATAVAATESVVGTFAGVVPAIIKPSGDEPARVTAAKKPAAAPAPATLPPSRSEPVAATAPAPAMEPILAPASETEAAPAPATETKPAADPNAPKPAQGSTNQAAQAGTHLQSADIKADVPAPSTGNSASVTDTLNALRAPAGDLARAQAAHPALQSAPAATIQVYARMVERFDGRAQRFEVRLDPAELGRVDVRIEVGADKKVHAVLAAHDSAALTDLMRGQRALERALSDAGLDLADGGLKFELSSDNGRSPAGNQQRDGTWGSAEDTYVWRGFNTVDVAVEASAADLAHAQRSYSRRAARLDLVA